MTTVESVRRLVEGKKYFPVDIETFRGRYIIWLDSRKGLTGPTLDRRFDKTGFYAGVHGFDIERNMFFFYLSEELTKDIK